ncbi:DUF6398 domain-containing protein [Avrilella dinanensis]|uniref:DUF6398 domain-containing protein n=1 Tax=Avrilella dinanensis TaxID=2008672 RepID=UPI002409A17E|nr:DUF6398 domain-containing protein [Avrilella dinanensis]
MDKEKITEKQKKILDLAGSFCTQKLDDDYFQLAEKLIKKLGRKRNVPFATGKEEIWAAATVHALGTVNFLFDKSFDPYVSVDDINNYFGTNKSTVTAKSKLIREMLKMERFGGEFSTQRMEEENPFNNMVIVDGMIYPLSALPPEYQEMVKQARKEGKNISFNTK